MSRKKTPAPAPEAEGDDTRVKLDYTRISVVVLCSGCPWWRGFALDRIEGWQVGARHQSMFHEGNTQAAKALSDARRAAAASRR